MQLQRWQQRFENLNKAFLKLNKAVVRYKASPEDELMGMALIQAFEFSFELSWKTLKDYLKHEGVLEATTPRQVIKQAFHFQLIENGQIWIDMLENRNLLSHAYSEESALQAHQLIVNTYADEIKQLCTFLSNKNDQLK